MGSPKRVQLSRKKGWRKPDNCVVVSRPGKWGNPFVVGKTDHLMRGPVDRAGAVAMFRDMLTDPELRAAYGYPTDLCDLAGKDLACWCPLNLPCHADVLIEFANSGPQHREDRSESAAKPQQQEAKSHD
jgi:hypothetical protein